MRKRTEEGASLLGLLVSVVLIIVVCGGAFYGYSSFGGGSDDTGSLGEKAKDSVDTSVVGSTLRMDLSGASAVQLGAGGQSLKIAKGDGSCILWSIGPGAVGGKELQRAAAFNMKADSSTLATVSSGIESGSFGSTSAATSLRLSYSGGQSFSDEVPYSGNGQVGECW